MKIHKTRGAVAVAMLVGVSVLAGCGGDSKDEAVDVPPVVTPSATSTPSTTPTGSPSPSGSATPGGEAEFLTTSDLPAGERYGAWKVNETKDGLRDPEYFCMKGELPAADTEFTTFGSDLEAEATQFIVTADSEAAAQTLEDDLEEALLGCVDRYEQAYPDDAVSEKSYDDVPGTNPALMHGVFFAPEGSEYTLQLFGVARSGSTVTVVVLGQGGKEAEAPVDAFRTMMSAAMSKLG